MITGYFLDGEWAQSHDVSAHLTGMPEDGTWTIIDAASGAHLAHWPAAELVRKPARKGIMRLSATSAPLGARLVLFEDEEIAEAERLMPALARQRHRQRGRQAGLLAGSTALLAGVVAAYVWGIPLAAGPITAVMPAEWETELGHTAATQIEQALGDGQRMRACNIAPQSAANLAISRFVERVLDGQSSPFPVEVMVGQSDVPNAFAIPGGRIYYTSALLEETEDRDEFAGVIAHEIGHVVHRHAMQNIVTAAGTGLIIGFILGDMTGLSVAGGLGAMIIDAHNSRQAETEADVFAADAARRLGYDPTALGTLLQRVAEDDSGAAVLALLSSHPLTAERKQNLRQLSADVPVTGKAFSDFEWETIKTMCRQRKISGGADASDSLR